MPIRWATPPRQSYLDRILTTLDTASGGVVLAGPDGIGKTTLAQQAVDSLNEQEVVHVTGTTAQQAVPFGAFSHLIDIAEVGKPAALIRAALDSLLDKADGALIVIDDAHLLDPLSASLVYQLAHSDYGRLVVTVASTAPTPEAITALWDDDLLVRIDVETMTTEEAAAAITAAGAIADADDLLRRTGGNPLHLRLLVQADGGASDRSLGGLIDQYLDAQPDSVRRTARYLAVHEPLSPAVLEALTNADAVARAEDAGLIRTVAGSTYAGHPRYLERVAASLSAEDARTLRSDVAGQLSATALRHVGDRLERAILLVNSDTPFDADEVAAAAEEALRLGDLRLCERLAEAALAQGDRFNARMALAHSLAWQGRGREAGFVLGAVDPENLSEDQIMAWAVPRAANQFFMLSEPERATAFLQNTQRRITTPASRITLDALSATFAMNAGNITRAMETATAVLSAPQAPDTAVAWASSAAALCSARMGRFDQVTPMVRRAMSSEHPGLLRFTVGLAETTTLLMAGQGDAAYETALRFTDFAELAQPGRAIGELLLAQVLIARGDQAQAAELLEPAAATLERTGYSWGALSLMYLAVALAQQGLIAEAAKAMSRAESRHGTKSALFAPELGVARAWRLAATGDQHGAIAATRDAAKMAERGGQSAIAVFALHESARLGDTRAATELTKFATSVDCGFTRLALTHASAVAARDAVGLSAAADQLLAAGFKAAAADAAAQAQRLVDVK